MPPIRTHSTRSLCARPTSQLQHLSTRPSGTAVLLAKNSHAQAKQRRVHARGIRRLRHVGIAGCIAIAISPEIDHTMHAACDGPVICMDAERLNLSKNDRSGNGNGLELSERREKHHFFPSKRNKEQIRHVLVGTINFHLMLVATRNLVKLVRSRRRLGGVSDTPVEGPISFNGGRERRFLVEQKVDVCFLLCSGRLVHVNFV